MGEEEVISYREGGADEKACCRRERPEKDPSLNEIEAVGEEGVGFVGIYLFIVHTR